MWGGGPIPDVPGVGSAFAGSDFLQLNPASAPSKGLTNWLVDALRTAIAEGRLTAGCRLPATRILAAELRISRGVVVEAYQRLCDEGLTSARTGVGTVVTSLGSPRGHPPARPDPALAAPCSPAGDASFPANAASSATAAPYSSGGLRLPLSPARRPAGIDLDLSPGVPDLSAFPRAAWLRAERAVLSRASGADLGYGDPRGNVELRRRLADWLGRIRGIRADAGGIIIVAGVAQALAMLAQTLHARGTAAVAVEDPGSRGARDAMAHWGLRPVPASVDEDGLRVDELAASGLDAVLITPAHQFPTGVVLSPQRRHALLDWAESGGLILEDDYDAEHRYDRKPVAALQASIPDRVAHIGSVSKTLAPGMRLGWLVPPRPWYDDLVTAKHASDLGNPVLPQLILGYLLATGEYERHLRRVRARQRDRRDALLAALREHLPEAQVGGVAAGLHLLVTLPHLAGLVDDAELARQIGSAGVLVHPLSWHRQRPGAPGLVLGYAAHPPDRLRDAARRLAQIVHRRKSQPAVAGR